MRWTKQQPTAPPATSPSPPGDKAAPRKPRTLSKATARRRRTRARPERGWGLIGQATERLGLGDKLHTYLACRAFALSLHRLLPRLEPQARAEVLQEGTLVVRVSSSAVASELVYVKDLLLQQVNMALDKLASESGTPASRPSPAAAPKAVTASDSADPTPKKRVRRAAVVISRFVWRVAPVKALPAYADWVAWTPRSTPRPRPRPTWDLAVAKEVTHVEDSALRDALQAMYAAATEREK
jgi:hypothetical protein